MFKRNLMFKGKLMMLAGLALAVVALSPASASAKAGGTDRPHKGTVSGTVSLNVLTGALTAHANGVATHLGVFTTSLEGTVTITPTGTFGSGTQTIVAANGDELTGTYTLSTPGAPGVAHTTTLVSTCRFRRCGRDADRRMRGSCSSPVTKRELNSST